MSSIDYGWVSPQAANQWRHINTPKEYLYYLFHASKQRGTYRILVSGTDTFDLVYWRWPYHLLPTTSLTVPHCWAGNPSFQPLPSWFRHQLQTLPKMSTFYTSCPEPDKETAFKLTSTVLLQALNFTLEVWSPDRLYPKNRETYKTRVNSHLDKLK